MREILSGKNTGKKILKSTFIFISLLAAAVILYGGAWNMLLAAGKLVAGETALFKYDGEKREITPLVDKIKGYMPLNFVSVTTDQPIYWPNENINLKVIAPLRPNCEFKLTLQKKNSGESELGKFKLNEAGFFTNGILSGAEKKLEIGEYTLKFETSDKKCSQSVSFAVVEGALGALSFAHEFKKLTNAEALKEVPGGWYLGNASGIGKRWGNGLNVKNEIRKLNAQYNGEVKIKVRCHLPGCNGCEAGPEQAAKIENGVLEAALDVSSHSGPFEIEVITPDGSIKNLFEKSGHVERQLNLITRNFTKTFNATIAPYENAKPVAGREIYIVEDKSAAADNPVEIDYPVADKNGMITFTVKKELESAAAYVFYYDESGELKTDSVKLESPLKKDKKIEIKCMPPYSLITIAGFEKTKSVEAIKKPHKTENDAANETELKFYEGFAIAFTETKLKTEINGKDTASPLGEYELNIKSYDGASNKPVSCYGILEVFDNRVADKSAKEPLISAIGDSYRSASNVLSSWRDWSGIDMEMTESIDRKANLGVLYESDAPSASQSSLKKSVSRPMSMPAPAAKAAVFSASAGSSRGYGSRKDGDMNAAVDEQEKQEEIREGEKKVVYCELIKTDNNGVASVKVKMPPQTGRCKARFIACDKFDYSESVKEIDVSKSSYTEAVLPSIITPGSRLKIKAKVENLNTESVSLNISGGGIEKEQKNEAAAGSSEITFELSGKNYGKLSLALADKKGAALDKREFEIKNAGTMPFTFSNISVSNASPIKIAVGSRAFIYSNPAKLLSGIIKQVVTIQESWFKHAEALSFGLALDAMLLNAIESGILNDEGFKDKLKNNIAVDFKTLSENFYNKETGLIKPYPEVAENAAWTIWVCKNLNTMLVSLSSNPALKTEFEKIINDSAEMVEKMTVALSKANLSIKEYGLGKAGSDNQEMVPIVVDGKVVQQVLTDDSVVKFFTDNVIRKINFDSSRNFSIINAALTKELDKFRLLKAFEHTGAIYYMLLNAKALYLKNDPQFTTIFNVISRNMALINESGLIKGPALTGGVYSAPQTLLKYVELLLLIAKDHKIGKEIEFESISANGKSQKLTTVNGFYEISSIETELTVKLPAYAMLREDYSRDINVYDYMEQKPFFAVDVKDKELKVSHDTKMTVTLDKDKDPVNYYAVIVVPSVTSIKQTEDILSDYKGNVIYGQKSSSGVKMQIIEAPFKGKRDMTIELETVFAGESEGFVLVRNLGNPDEIVTVKTVKIKAE